VLLYAVRSAITATAELLVRLMTYGGFTENICDSHTMYVKMESYDPFRCLKMTWP